MANTLLYVSLQDNTAPKTEINVTVTPAFPAASGGASVFWGVAPNNGNRGPGAAASIVPPNLILIQGGFEQAFVEAFVDASNGVSGSITVNPPIPVPITISFLGAGSIFTLPANIGSGQFKIAPAGQAADAPPASSIQARAALVTGDQS